MSSSLSARPESLPAEWAAAFETARPRLGPLAAEVLYFPSIGSTNDVASALASGSEKSREGAVIIADTQTAGRGRRGRSWFSPPGAGLYVSVILEPARAHAADLRATTLLTLAAGVALAEGIEAATALPAEIKWPNDLVIGQRKCAGILAEGVTAPDRRQSVTSVILGYGINVSRASYPRDIEARATALETELGRPIDRVALGVETLVALARRYDDLVRGRFDAILDAWRQRAPASRNARVNWQGPSGAMTGITAGIDDDGALLVRVGDRLERLVAGEVIWV